MNKPIKRLQQFLDRPWYPIILGTMAAADVLVIFIPIDGLTVGAVLATPKRWLRYAFGVALGNTAGCLILAGGIHSNAPWITERFSSWMHTAAWQSVSRFFEWSGGWSIILGAISPIPLQVWVIVPVLAGMSLLPLAAALLVGRILRSLALCWAASHAPRLLRRSRKVMHELEETRQD